MVPDMHANDHEQYVAQAERLLAEAVMSGDSAQVRELLHPDFREVGQSGRVFDRAGILDDVASRSPKPPYILENLRCVGLSTDIVLATYRAIAATDHGVRVSERSSVWLCNGGTWQLYHHQGTPCPEQ